MRTVSRIKWCAQRIALAVPLGLVGIAHGQTPQPLQRPDVELVDVGEIQSMIDQPHYGLLIAGTFTQVNGEARNGLARMVHGHVDPGWNPNPSWLGAVPLVPRRVKMSPDGGVFVSGDLVEIAGHGVDCIAKLKPDGQLDTAWTTPTTNCDFDPVFDHEGWMYFIDSDHAVKRTRLDIGGSADPNWAHYPAVWGNGYVPYKLMLEFGDSLYIASSSGGSRPTTRISKVNTALGGYERWSDDDQEGNVVAMQQNEYGDIYLAYAHGKVRRYSARHGWGDDVPAPNPPLTDVREMKLDSSGFSDSLYFAASGGVRKISASNGQELASYPVANRDFVNQVLPDTSGVLMAGKFSAVSSYESQSLIYVGAVMPGPPTPHEITGPGKVHGVVRQPNGGAIVRGSFIKADKLSRRDLFRLTPAGIVDPAWSVQLDDAVEQVVVDSNNQVYLEGQFNVVNNWQSRFVVKLDGTSGSPVFEWASALGLQVSPSGLAIDAQDRIYIATAQRVDRLLATLYGDIDPNWSVSTGEKVADIHRIGDMLYLRIRDYWGRPSVRRVALTDGAAIDGSWRFDPDLNGPGELSVNSVEGDLLGNIIIGGRFDFRLDNGDWVSNLARFAPLGYASADESWLPSINGSVNDVAVDAAGEIYIAGDFSSVGGQSSNGLAKLSPIDATPRADWMPAHGARSICVADAQRLFVVGDDWRNTFVALPLTVGNGGDVPAIERN